jgi:hypothetical protein
MLQQLHQRLYLQDAHREGGQSSLGRLVQLVFWLPSSPVPPFAPSDFLVTLSSSVRQSTCVSHCSDKFLKHSERVGARFAEHNAGQSRRELSLVPSRRLFPPCPTSREPAHRRCRNRGLPRSSKTTLVELIRLVDLKLASSIRARRLHPPLSRTSSLTSVFFSFTLCHTAQMQPPQ